MNEDGKYGELTTIPKYKGPETSLDRQLKQLIRIFIEDCFYMGIPWCKGRLAIDIQEYLKRNDIHVANFIDEKPGNVCFLSTYYFVSLE